MSGQSRANLGLAARIVVSAAVFAFLFTRVSLQSLAASFRGLPVGCVVGALALVSLAAVIALVRWRALLRAYGAETLPTYRESARIFGGALFYNLLPGAIGGDAYRGYATRQCFANGAAASSLSVVFVDRVMGLAGLFALIALTWPLTGRADNESLTYACLGFAVAASAVVGVSSGQYLAPYLPAPLSTWALQLPKVQRYGFLLMAAGLSVVTHTLLSFAGHLLIRNFGHAIEITDSLVTFPLGTLASYFPLTVAGAGARDGALAFFFGKLGVASPGVLAVSLCLLGCDLTVALLGGLLHAMMTRVSVTRQSFSRV